MPLVSVDHFAGPDESQRRRLQQRLAEVVMKEFAAPPGNVRVFLRAFDPADVWVADGNIAGGMPVIRVEFLPGRSLAQKRALVQGLATVVAEELQADIEQIRTVLFERQRDEWGRGAGLVSES